MPNQYSKPRPIRVEGDVAYVPLTQGYEAIIDACDVPIANQYKWFSKVRSQAVYAVSAVYTEAGRKPVYLHRLISNPKPGQGVDHIDHNGLNNRRQNLRNCTHNQNMWNCRNRKNNTSGFKGVSWFKPSKKWMARIAKNGKDIHLGIFETKEEAYAAYCEASRELHGEHGYAGPETATRTSAG